MREVPKNWPLITALTAGAGGAVAALRAASPVQDLDQPASWFMVKLFPNDPLVCVGKTRSYFRTRPLSKHYNLGEKQLFVPSAMSKVWGKKSNGRGQSMHTNDNTGPRERIVVEFDRKIGIDHDQMVKIGLHLAQFAPLEMVVDSGNTSLHFHYNCKGSPPEQVERFFIYACSIGGDHALWTMCQFVRIPNGTRDNGKKQQVLFFDPAPTTQWADAPFVVVPPAVRKPRAPKAPPTQTDAANQAPAPSVEPLAPAPEPLPKDVVDRIIRTTIPEGTAGQTGGLRLRLLQRVKGWEVAQRKLTPGERETIYSAWYTAGKAAGGVHPEKPGWFYCSRLRASYSYVSVAAPLEATISTVLDAVKTAVDLPQADGYPKLMRRLVSICKGLSEAPWPPGKVRSWPGEFFLGVRSVETILRVSGPRAREMVKKLVADGVIVMVVQGDWSGGKCLASRFRLGGVFNNTTT